MNRIQLICEYPHIKHLLLEVQEDLELILEQRGLAYDSIQCPVGRFGQAPQPQGRTGDPTGQQAIMMVDHYDDQIERLKAHERVLQGMIKEAHAVLKLLTPLERHLVELRYFQQRQWHDVCASLGCGRAKAHDTRKQVLEKLKRGSVND